MKKFFGVLVGFLITTVVFVAKVIWAAFLFFLPLNLVFAALYLLGIAVPLAPTILLFVAIVIFINMFRN